MIYVQLWGFYGISGSTGSRESKSEPGEGRDHDLRSVAALLWPCGLGGQQNERFELQKEFKKIQKDFKRSKERGGIMIFVQLNGFHGFRRSNGIEKAKQGSRG